MSWRVRIWGMAAVLLTLWPLAHATLVHRHGMSAWKLAGWGMYSEPQSFPQVEVRLRSPAGVTRLDPRSLGDAGRLAFGEFLLDRGTLGELAPADDLADAIFAEHPEVTELRVILRTRRLDRETSRIQEDEATLDYARP